MVGAVLMSFFFIISGFVLAINEGQTKCNPHAKCCSLFQFPLISDNSAQTHQFAVFNRLHFYQRRMARTLPMYYLLNLFALPLVFLGYSQYCPFLTTTGYLPVYVSSFLTIFVATTWFGVPLPLNGPSWFVSTIWFCYLLFPFIFPYFQCYNVSQLKKWVKRYFWMQFFGSLAIAVVFQPKGFMSGISAVLPTGLWFWLTTFWPVPRLPLFLVGVLAGLLRIEKKEKDQHLPFLFFGQTFRDKEKRIDYNQECNDITLFLSVVLTIGCVVRYCYPFVPLDFIGQIVLAWFMLKLVFALTKCDENNQVYRIFTNRVALFFGKISYTLYLVHEPLIAYGCWMIYGTQKAPDCESIVNIEQASN